MKKIIFSFVIILLIVNTTSALNPTALRCEFAENPMGVDVAQPRLYWWVESDKRNQKQTAYRILVASTPELLAQDVGNIWDSGKVNSDQTAHVNYQGKKLVSSQQVFWKVRVWVESRPRQHCCLRH